MDSSTLLHLLVVAAAVLGTSGVCFLTYVLAVGGRPSKLLALRRVADSGSQSGLLALSLTPWSWLAFEALGTSVDPFFVAIGVGLCLRIAMFSARVQGFRSGAAEPHAELHWRALALGFTSCSLLWMCVALDGKGVLPMAFSPAAWQ